MSHNKNSYSPEPEVIEALARPVLDSTTKEVVEAEVESAPAKTTNEQVPLDDENTKIAVEHIKDTLLTLQDLLHDLKELAPASQQGFLFQTAAIIAKTRLEGSNMLAALQGKTKPPSEEKRGGARSNHLHLNVTSAQFGEFIASQVKKAKDGK